MPFYDNFFVNEPSFFGNKLALWESRNVLRKILPYKKNVLSMLEVGPGRGPFMRSIQDKDMQYACVDVSLSALGQLENSNRICAMVPPLPIVMNSFDIVFASNVLEHMLDFRAALIFVEEMTRVVRPGGLVCHRVPNAMAWGMHFWNGDYTHSFATTPRNVSQLYADVGLKIENIYPVAGSIVGYWANWLSVVGKIIPSSITNHGALLDSRFNKMVYSLKTTFLNGFLIIGRKV